LVCFDLNRFINFFQRQNYRKQKDYFVISLRHHDVKAQWFSIRPCQSHNSNDYLSFVGSSIIPQLFVVLNL
jgi:hypothetical protein